MVTIGKRIKFLREQRKLSQQVIADNTGISRGNISNYEKDRVVPAAETIIALAHFFNVTTDWLLTGRDYKDDLADNPGNTDEFQDRISHSYKYTKLTSEEYELLEIYRNFAVEDQAFIRQMILFKNGQVKDGLKKKVESSIS